MDSRFVADMLEEESNFRAFALFVISINQLRKKITGT
jgi:hypothetical protein